MAIRTIGLDGDDTLWHSENHFVVTTERLVELVEPWLTDDGDAGAVESRLIEIERRNLSLLGYGVKAFTLSMIETAIEASDGTIPAGAIGFLGNEVAAQVRLRGGRRLNSPALIADGNHARVDGYVSLGVVGSAIVVALGFPSGDPIIGIAISLVILKVTWDSWRTIRAEAHDDW